MIWYADTENAMREKEINGWCTWAYCLDFPPKVAFCIDVNGTSLGKSEAALMCVWTCSLSVIVGGSTENIPHIRWPKELLHFWSFWIWWVKNLFILILFSERFIMTCHKMYIRHEPSSRSVEIGWGSRKLLWQKDVILWELLPALLC